MRPIEKSDILSRTEYERRRDEIRRRVMTEKAKRRVPVGDHCTVHFENRETMFYQVHEMLRAEGTWDNPSAVADELHAYNPLIPSEGEFSATVMFEYPTREERATMLPRFTGIDRHIWIQIGDTEPILASLDRGQIDESKISSVQYAKWRLDDTRRRLLGEEGTVVRLRIDHPAYRAQAVLSEDTRKALLADSGPA